MTSASSTFGTLKPCDRMPGSVGCIDVANGVICGEHDPSYRSQTTVPRGVASTAQALTLSAIR